MKLYFNKATNQTYFKLIENIFSYCSSLSNSLVIFCNKTKLKLYSALMKNFQKQFSIKRDRERGGGRERDKGELLAIQIRNN